MSRLDYVQYDDHSADVQATFKKVCTTLESMIETLKPPREKALAITKLEECYAWIGKAIRNEQIERDGKKAKLQEGRLNS